MTLTRADENHDEGANYQHENFFEHDSPHAIDFLSKNARSEAVVDVDDAHARRATVQHCQKCGKTSEQCTVTNALGNVQSSARVKFIGTPRTFTSRD